MHEGYKAEPWLLAHSVHACKMESVVCTSTRGEGKRDGFRVARIYMCMLTSIFHTCFATATTCTHAVQNTAFLWKKRAYEISYVKDGYSHARNSYTRK